MFVCDLRFLICVFERCAATETWKQTHADRDRQRLTPSPRLSVVAVLVFVNLQALQQIWIGIFTLLVEFSFPNAVCDFNSIYHFVFLQKSSIELKSTYNFRVVFRFLIRLFIIEMAKWLKSNSSFIWTKWTLELRFSNNEGSKYNSKAKNFGFKNYFRLFFFVTYNFIHILVHNYRCVIMKFIVITYILPK